MRDLLHPLSYNVKELSSPYCGPVALNTQQMVMSLNYDIWDTGYMRDVVMMK